MKLRRSKSSKRGRIEIIPMIDVMFFLLATFMIASLSLQKLSAVDINLPKGEAADTKIESQLTISIKSDGRILLNKNPVTIVELKSQLKEFKSDKRIVIAADKNVTHENVVKVMIAAQASGISDFAIAVEDE